MAVRSWSAPREAARRARDLLAFRTSGQVAVFWRNDGTVETLSVDKKSCIDRMSRPAVFGLVGVYAIPVPLAFLVDDFLEAYGDEPPDDGRSGA